MTVAESPTSSQTFSNSVSFSVAGSVGVSPVAPHTTKPWDEFSTRWEARARAALTSSDPSAANGVTIAVRTSPKRALVMTEASCRVRCNRRCRPSTVPLLGAPPRKYSRIRAPLHPRSRRRRSRTLRVRSLLAPSDQDAMTLTAPPRSELGFNRCWPYFRCGALGQDLGFEPHSLGPLGVLSGVDLDGARAEARSSRDPDVELQRDLLAGIQHRRRPFPGEAKHHSVKRYAAGFGADVFDGGALLAGARGDQRL